MPRKRNPCLICGRPTRSRSEVCNTCYQSEPGQEEQPDANYHTGTNVTRGEEIEAIINQAIREQMGY